MCDKVKLEALRERGKEEQSARKISRCARNDGGGNGFISRSVQRICLESAIPRNVIPSEAEGSFWHTGIASYVRQRKRGNLLRKEQERAECEEYFSTLLEMTVWGNGVISRSVQRICLENAISVMSSRAKPSIFLAHRYSVLCETAEKGNPSVKGARKNKVQGRFLAALEMTVWGNGFISRSVQRICLESAIPVSSSRAKWRDLSGTPV